MTPLLAGTRGCFTILAVFALVACKQEPDDTDEAPGAGEACDPASELACAEGLACEPTSDGANVCGAPLEIRGQVFDVETSLPIAAAHVAAFDETGAPVTDVAITDADGRYTLAVSAVRDPTGAIASSIKWTLNVAAVDYQPYPFGVRPAIPVDAQDAVEEGSGDTDGGPVVQVIDNAATSIGLIPNATGGGATLSGTVGEAGAGALVVAEGAAVPAPYAVADLSGHFTIFNVPAGELNVRAYRWGAEFEPMAVMAADGDEISNLELVLVSDDPAALGTVSGSVNIVDGGGAGATSVVLVPSSVFNLVLERGPVPAGLRSPHPPAAPDVTNAFTLDGVPAGTFMVLAAFENDELVRDPDESIAGTQLQEVTVASGQDVPVPDAFKVTGALQTLGPGADAPEVVTAPPDLRWVDDSSETDYLVEVFDVAGNQVMTQMLPEVSGGDVVVPYSGDALVPEMYYQFRAYSLKTTPQGTSKISRTEDLRGVFVYRPGGGG